MFSFLDFFFVCRSRTSAGPRAAQSQVLVQKATLVFVLTQCRGYVAMLLAGRHPELCAGVVGTDRLYVTVATTTTATTASNDTENPTASECAQSSVPVHFPRGARIRASVANASLSSRRPF
jgi:hypothetical protein